MIQCILIRIILRDFIVKVKKQCYVMKSVQIIAKTWILLILFYRKALYLQTKLYKTM